MFVCPINLIMMWTWRFYIKPPYLSRYPWEPLMTYLQQTTRPTSYQLENTVWEGWGQWHLTPPKIKYCKFHTGILNSVPCSLCHQIWCLLHKYTCFLMKNSWNQCQVNVWNFLIDMFPLFTVKKNLKRMDVNWREFIKGKVWLLLHLKFFHNIITLSCGYFQTCFQGKILVSFLFSAMFFNMVREKWGGSEQKFWLGIIVVNET